MHCMTAHHLSNIGIAHTSLSHAHLAAEVPRAEDRVDLARLQELLELLRQIARSVRDVQVSDTEDQHRE